MDRSERIRGIITQGLTPSYFQLTDDSAKHAGHAGARPEGQTHYSLVLESQAFAGLNQVKRHQLIYGLLEPELKSGLHALSIQAYAPGERP